ncbi:hypothetical protein JCM8547_004635 [Rhodosporidiobolus lusitaniae]
MAALPSTADLGLSFDRLSLGAYAPPPQPIRHHTPASASSSLERPTSSSLHNGGGGHSHSPYPSSSAGQQPQPQLQPHQIMQPPLHSGPPPHVQLAEPQRRKGVVKFFNSLKGFGFVVDNDPAALGGQEVFCHFSAISGKGGFRSLAEGEEVEYELVQGPKGFQAANLTGPGGRTVVGDPKARMQKPPAYLPFAPMALPIGGPYLDPYHAQHGAVYAGSPYTSHVLYVPATASLPPSQYAYAPVPLQAAPPRAPPPPSGGGNAPPAPGQAGTSPFAAPQYQSYAAAPPAGGAPLPPPSAAGAALNGAPPSADGSSDRYASLSRIGAATGAYGAPERGYPVQPQGPASFSPPGGGAQYVGLPHTGGSPPLNGGAANGAANGGGGFGGFAPFSPPSFNHPTLFGAPPQGFYAAPPHPQSQSHSQSYASHSDAAPSGAVANGQPSTPSSALFGSIPAPIGSRSGTPAAGAGGRSTPALGNGSLGSDAWRTGGSPAGSAVL